MLQKINYDKIYRIRKFIWLKMQWNMYLNSKNCAMATAAGIVRCEF